MAQWVRAPDCSSKGPEFKSHQEQQQQWSTGIWSLEDDSCATKGMAGEVTQALGGAQKIVSWIPDIGWLD